MGAVARIVPHLNKIRRGGHQSAALLLERNADKFPDRPALRYLDESHTWAELDVLANRWAHFLSRRGIAHGDVVALVMDNRTDYVAMLLGASKLRAVTACVNTNLTGAALSHAISVARPALVVAGSEHEAAVRGALAGMSPVPQLVVRSDRGGAASADSIDEELSRSDSTRIEYLRPSNDEAMTYLYTSGTTGLPKAAVVTNQRFMAAAIAFGKVMHRATPEDVIYVPLPLYHGTGQWGGLGAALSTGACLALRRKFSATAFWADVVSFGATRVVYIGELCRYLLHTQECPEEMRHGVQVMVGNGLRPDVWKPFQERFQIPMIREFYGATEGNAPVVNHEGRAGMLGRLTMGQAVIACDLATGEPARNAAGRCERAETAESTGLLIAKISRLMTFDGYVDKKATESKILHDVFSKGDTWFNTGDLVTVHENKWLSFADRVGDTFRWKGENVSTSEVALTLNEAPGVLESTVYGVSVPGSDGRAGMASLRVSSSFDFDVFAQHVTAKLPRYARPLFLRLEEDLRVTSTFKHQKSEYQKEGFDPAAVKAPLFFLAEGAYKRLGPDEYERIQSGELVPG